MAGTRKERMVAFHRGNILEAARKAFQKNGIAGTKMEDIAKEAEYSKTTIYSYFSSKEDLVNHLFFEGMDLLNNKLGEEAAKAGSFVDFYNKFCALITKIHDKNPIYYEGISAHASDNEDAPSDRYSQEDSFFLGGSK